MERTNKLTDKLNIQTNKLIKELGEKNLLSAEQKRYFDAISAEWVKWINEFREKSSEFLKLLVYVIR
ncbi:hypothetical protein FKQ51_12085 [Bacillus toyonensis]|uniref:hypothetical protein n=1 Tax=Bacillus TaxID=1386 RepID=UPI0018F699C7|nr:MULTISPECIES: hypothetical protein [Bacillus]MBJ8066897.1 hypothetical protein [Bacillus cereus group sp. N15]MCS3599267.1 hypothetical protein [Bacillus sp. JUb91]MDO8158087.1 hypothetical protein [Bacillus toyonensis]HDR7447989.1 hypothetical protein [Bacillus toyonensis]